MNITHGLIAGSILGVLTSAKDYKQTEQLEQWAQHLGAKDRDLILNHEPLPPIPEPANPGVFIFKKSFLWLYAGLATWLIPTILLSFIGATVGAEGFGAILIAFIGAFMAFSFFFFGPVGIIVGCILFWREKRRKDQALVQHSIKQGYRQIWEAREDARTQLATGRKPIQYLEAIGLNPQHI